MTTTRIGLIFTTRENSVLLPVSHKKERKEKDEKRISKKIKKNERKEMLKIK